VRAGRRVVEQADAFGTLPGFPSEAKVRNAGPDGGAGAGTRPRPSSQAAPRAARTRARRKAAVVSAGVTGGILRNGSTGRPTTARRAASLSIPGVISATSAYYPRTIHLSQCRPARGGREVFLVV
jgi:hypothetical protein